MNSYNHPSAYGYQPPRATGFHQPKPPMPEDVLHDGLIEIERKTFRLALKENQRGRFLRITEKKDARVSTIIVPASGLKEFQTVLADMIAADAATPGTPPPSQP